ncbi:MAG: hypothetical protein GY795_41885 [Desulfobacterales bacterium]|nr:hypothetical protein [Desulfobacterales bacterium]
MSINLRSIFMVLMSCALFFGFLHLFVPDGESYNFERLHIFLFNLCSGGTIVLFYTENREKISCKVILFALLAICYAIFAFLKLYIPAIIVSPVLALIVEIIRIKKFSIFPVNFFRASAPVSEKFHQASLLCLSIGLMISCLVMLNNEYLKIISLPKLKLDTFFLGFSFPLSLITMSVMFSLMKDDGRIVTVLKNTGFWAVNLGVIIFFLYILFERLVPQIIVTTILFATVIMIFNLFRRLGDDVQQKNFLLSGMVFLLVTAITGILYIILEFFPEYYNSGLSKFLLKLHSFASLYGWNLSGLAVICRYRDFPINLHSDWVIFLHWVIVLILAPLGVYFRFSALLAVISYTVLLYIIFSSGRKPNTSVTKLF